PSRNPITGIAGCCARAASGHAAAAPPSSVELAPLHSTTSSARESNLPGTLRPSAFFASPVGVRPGSARSGTVFGANEAQVPDDFRAAAVVRRMVDAIHHRHVGKIKRAHAF